MSHMLSKIAEKIIKILVKGVTKTHPKAKKDLLQKKGNSILRFTFYMFVLPNLKINNDISRFYNRLKAAVSIPKNVW